MDWLRLGLVLLAVAGHITAQQGYNYPKPKTPFSGPGDTTRDNRLPSLPTAGQSTSQGTQPQVFNGAQKPFGSQQPSGGYDNGVQSQTPQQPLGGYPGSGEPETSGVGNRPFGSQETSTGAGQKTPFGTQQQSGGYPSVGQSGTASFRAQSQTESPSLNNKPSTGYPGSSSSTQGSSGSQGSFRTAQFTGTQGPSETGTFSGTQGPSTVGPSSGPQGYFRTAPFSGTEGPFIGTQGPSGTSPFGVGSSGSTQGPIGTQQSEYQGGRPTAQDVSGEFSGQRRPNEPSFSGPGGQQSTFPSATTRTQYPGQDLNRPSTGRQEGYNYPTPQRSFEGTAPTTGISGDSKPGAPLFRQSPSQAPTREGFEESGLRGTPQFPSGRESLNGYSSSGQTRPNADEKQQTSNGFPSSGPQGSISSPRPSAVEQQTGYPQSGRPQSSFPSSTTERQQTLNRYSSSERPQGSFPSSRPTNQQTPNAYGQVGTQQSSFPSSSKYPGVDSKYPSGNGQSPDQQNRGETSYEGTPSGQSPPGQGNYPGGSESTGLVGRQNGSPRTDSRFERPTEAAGKSGFPERPTGQQFPVNAPLGGQVTNGYPTSTQQQTKSSLPGYQQGEQRPLSSYLPPGVKGTGELPLSQFPSTGFSQAPSSSQFPSGVSEAPRPSGNGYTDSFKPTGGLSNGRTPAQVPSGTLERSQNGFGSAGTPTIDGSTSRFPSELPGQPSRSQSGYDVSRTPTGRGSFESGTPTYTDGSSSRVPSGLPDQSPRTQNGYDASRTSPGRGSFESGTPSSRLPSGLPDQSPRSQNGYNGVDRRPFESGRPTGSSIDQGQEEQEGAGRYPTLAKSSQPFAPRYSSDQRFQQGSDQGFLRPVSGQAFPGSQQGFRDQQRPFPGKEGSFDEEEEGDFSAIPGQPGRDYPILSDVPETSFNCDDQEYIGYYADVETRCQIFHICANNKTYDFLCPNGTIFHQQNLVCVWWNQFECETAPSLYRINKDIYELSIVRPQETGGIPIPGQDYPDLSEGGFGFGRQPGLTSDNSIQRPGGYPGEEGLRGPGGIQREYPRGRAQDLTGPQGTAGYSSEDSRRPSNGVGGFPNGRPQGSIGPASTRYSNGKLPGSGGYQSPIGDSKKPENGDQSPQGYPGRTEGQDTYQTSSGDVQRPGTGVQRPAAARPQGSIGSPYPNAAGKQNSRQGSDGQPQAVEEQRHFQKSGNGRPQDVGYPSERPQGANGYQYPNGEQQTETGAQRFGGRPEDAAGREPQNYPSGRPAGSNGSQFSTPAQRPGQYSEGSGDLPQINSAYPQGSSSPSGQGKQTPVEYGTPERTQRPEVSPGPTEYPSGAPGASFRTSAPTGSGSLFPGSSQPHQPTREYLPTV